MLLMIMFFFLMVKTSVVADGEHLFVLLEVAALGSCCPGRRTSSVVAGLGIFGKTGATGYFALGVASLVTLVATCSACGFFLSLFNALSRCILVLPALGD